MGRASYLSPPDFHRLDWACRPVAVAFHAPVYLVGSVLRTADYRDIDLRLILPDDHPYILADKITRQLVGIALSDLIASMASQPRPIDFQIQSMSEANVPDHGARNPLGVGTKFGHSGRI